jgi:FKBP-type peptidyl-prolyl cis-trans isomerase
MILSSRQRSPRRFAPIRSSLLSVLAASGLALLQVPTAFAQGTAETDDEKAFYAIGASLAGQVQMLSPISDREMDLILEGMRDGVAGRAGPDDPAASRTRIRNLVQARQEAGLKIEKDAAVAFLASEAKKPGATKTVSGLIYTEIKAGTGDSPTATDKVKVHYHGTLRDGTIFDSSVDRGEPAEFPLNRVIPCWTEGVAMMKVGGKSLLVCPADIAYGDQRKGRIPGGAALSFEVELIEIVK